jgi:hypothetical protein
MKLITLYRVLLTIVITNKALHFQLELITYEPVEGFDLLCGDELSSSCRKQAGKLVRQTKVICEISSALQLSPEIDVGFHALLVL